MTYLRLLDAQWDRADWQELAIDPAILHIDLVREPIRSHRAWAPGTRPLATENGYRISCATAPTLSFGLLPNWQRPSRGGSRQTPFFCPVPATAATEIVPLPFTEAQAQHPPEIDQPRLDFAVSPGKMAVNCGDVWGWGLTLRPEYYRQNARDCLRLANTTSDPRSKVMLIDMALAWRGLADRAASIRRQSYPTVASDQTRESA